jgi:ribonuclease P protein component
MLPPANRLRKEKEIKRALASRNARKNGPLACKTAANDLAAARFCFVVSKRISNKAAVRNKLKRRLRAAVAALLDQARPGVDCVLIAHSGLEAKTYAEIALIVKKVLMMAGILDN